LVGLGRTSPALLAERAGAAAITDMVREQGWQ